MTTTTADPGFDFDALQDELDAVSYARIPTILRRWLWPGYLPLGNPALFAGDGEVGKGMLLALVVAHVVLGIPFPGTDGPAEPGRVVWIAGMEDDPFEDLAPRLRAAISHLVQLHNLDPELATDAGAIRWIHDLSEWRDGSAFALPADCDRLLATVRDLGSKLTAGNRPRDPDDDQAEPPGPPVRLVVMDPLTELLGEGYNIQTVSGARRVLRPLKRFARMADVAVVIIHHLTADGKVAGSPAVLDALRLAFVISRRKDNPDVRAITRRKSNISQAEPQQYSTVLPYPDTHAFWVDAADHRAERVKAASELPSDPAGLRARIRAAVSEPELSAAPSLTCTLLRRRQDASGNPGPAERIGRRHATPAAARAAAAAAARAPLDWRAVDGQPGTEVAASRDGAGLYTTYAVVTSR
jgi:hypothetical protein